MHDRASILVDSLVGVFLAVLVSYGAAQILGGTLSWMDYGIGSTQMQSDVLEVRTNAQADAQNAIAVFVPATDVFGAANTVAFGTAKATGQVTIPASSGHEFDTYAQPLGSVSFDAYYFSAATGVTEYRYMYRRPTDGAAMCSATAVCTASTLQIVNQWPSISAFSVSYYTVPNLPSIDPAIAQFASLYPNDLKDVTVRTGYSSDVLSGNRLVVFNITGTGGNSTITEQVQITAGEPLATGSLPVTYTPPPISGMQVTASPNPLILGFGGAGGLPSSGTITASVTNYHHDFTLNGTTVGTDAATSVNCGGVSTETLTREVQKPSGSPRTPPSSFPGTWMKFGASADSVGTCTATFATLAGLKPPDDVVKSASITIIVEGNLTMTSSPTPLVMCAPSTCSDNPTAGTVTVNLPGYNGDITLTSTCASYVSGIPSKVTLNGGTATFNVASIAATSSPCTITAVSPTSNGQQLAQGNAVLSATVITGPKIWPAFVRYSVSGSQFAMVAPRVPINIATILNAAMGGGVAYAATPCTAQAFTDTTATVASTPPPWVSGETVSTTNDNTYGCYDGQIWLTEPGASAFSTMTNSCNPNSLSALALPTPDANGTVAQQWRGGANTTPTCALPFQDNASRQISNQAQVVGGCSVVGGTCTFSISYVDGNPTCDPGADYASGYTGTGFALISPSSAGTWTTSDGGSTYTFTRSQLGTVTVSVHTHYDQYTTVAGPNCGSVMTSPQTSTFTIQ